MGNNFFDEGKVLNQLKEFENKITEELSKENADNEKIMKIRNEQLLKGMYLTQVPNYLL